MRAWRLARAVRASASGGGGRVGGWVWGRSRLSALTHLAGGVGHPPQGGPRPRQLRPCHARPPFSRARLPAAGRMRCLGQRPERRAARCAEQLAAHAGIAAGNAASNAASNAGGKAASNAAPPPPIVAASPVPAPHFTGSTRGARRKCERCQRVSSELPVLRGGR